MRPGPTTCRSTRSHLLMVVLQARVHLQETIHAPVHNDTRTSTRHTTMLDTNEQRNLVLRGSQLSDRFDIILAHGCYFIVDMVATSSPPRLRANVLERVFSSLLHLPSCLISLLIVARTGFPLSLSLSPSLSHYLSLPPSQRVSGRVGRSEAGSWGAFFQASFVAASVRRLAASVMAGKTNDKRRMRSAKGP